MGDDARHWHREPAEATRRFVESAEFTSTDNGMRLAIEFIAYPAGHVQVACFADHGQSRQADNRARSVSSCSTIAGGLN
jgi:hypothetical protein